MKLSDIILNEEPQPRQKVIDLNSLTFDLLLSMFGEKPAYGFKLPLPNDSTLSVFDEKGLENWKQAANKKYGNINIKIDTEAFNSIQVLDDKFIADKKAAIAAKGAWLDKERQSGRKSGLD